MKLLLVSFRNHILKSASISTPIFEFALVQTQCLQQSKESEKKKKVFGEIFILKVEYL